MSGAILRKGASNYIEVVGYDRWNVTGMPPRKAIHTISTVYSRQFFEELGRKSENAEPITPRVRHVPQVPVVEHRGTRPEVIAFGVGLLMLAVGLSGFLLGIAVKKETVNVLSWALIALGSALVALSLLRGQDLDGRGA